MSGFRTFSLDITDVFIHFIPVEIGYFIRRICERRGNVRVYTAVIEKCPNTGLFVGYIPGLRDAPSQGETLDELNHNLKEVVELLPEKTSYGQQG